MNPVGTSHTVTATVKDASGQPAQGVTVRFNVQGSSAPASGTCTTDANGQCSFTYQGPQLPGADIIRAFADTNNDGDQDVGEPMGEATKAWVAPVSTPGQVTGGGQILNAAGNDKIAFGFNAKSDPDTGKLLGNCTVVDPATDTMIKCVDVVSLVQAGTHATLFGNATIKVGQGQEMQTTYRIDVDDLAEPGKDQDTFKIQTDNGYTAGGVLTQGNIQVHQ